jgi:hypothetical protein
MISILVHIHNEDPVLGEVDSLPSPADTLLHVRNPRKKDGKDLIYLVQNVTEVIWPVNRIAFIEIMPSEEEDQIFGFVRE